MKVDSYLIGLSNPLNLRPQVKVAKDDKQDGRGKRADMRLNLTSELGGWRMNYNVKVEKLPKWGVVVTGSEGSG